MEETEEVNVIAMLQQNSLPALVQREIERMILAGDLRAGSKLNEAALATRLGVSRGPVREAFRALEEAGLVRQEKNCGVFVRQISLQEADEIYEVRAALDELVGRKLAASITPEQTAELNRMLNRMDQMVEEGNVDDYHAQNLVFHDLLVQMTGNNALLLTYRRLVNALHLYRRDNLTQRGTLPVSTREHRDIVDRIVSGDVVAAGETMRNHVLKSRSRMQQTQKPSLQ